MSLIALFLHQISLIPPSSHMKNPILLNRIFKALIVFSVLFLAVLLFAIFGIGPLIHSGIANKVLITPQTYELWGASPGQSQTPTIKNLTFYNFTNPRGYLYRGEKPVYREISGYLYQQRYNMTNCSFSEDMSELSYNFWLFFTEMEGSRNVHQQMNITNFVMLGYWNKLEQVTLSTFALQGFGNLFLELNHTLKQQAIGQGLSTQYLKIQSQLAPYCNSIGLSAQSCKMLWNDQVYGLHDPNHMLIWVQFAYQGDQGAESELQDYFGLERTQVIKLKELFNSWSYSMEKILNNWYCGGNNCTNYEFVLMQLGSGEVTDNPPSGKAYDSICKKQNDTCMGTPEISSYLRNVFVEEIDGSEKYRQMEFRRSTIERLFRPYTGVFLNYGNLTDWFEMGEAYDYAKESQPVLADIILQSMREAVDGETEDHAIVIWEYSKYFANQFVLRKSLSGTRKMAAMSGIFADAVYTSFTKFKDWIMPQLLSVLVAQKIQDCQKFILSTVEGIPAAKASQICQGVTVKNYKSFWKIIEPCKKQIPEEYELFREQYNFSIYEFEELCDREELSVYTVLQESHQILKEHYGCKSVSWQGRCSSHELAIMQFNSSGVTKNPPPSTLRNYPSALTGKHWDASLSEFEYRHFLKEFYGNESIDPQIHDNYSQLISLMSYDRFFSIPMTMKLLYENNRSQWKDKFYWSNASFLQNYVKFITIQVGFGGLTIKKSVEDILFGFEDPFLKKIKEKNTMLGGDPTLHTVLMLNDPNITEEQASINKQTIYTGVGDPERVRKIKSLFDKSYITYNKTWFDGYQEQYELTTPFRQNVEILASDGKQYKTGLTPDDRLFSYVSNIFKVSELKFTEEINRYGFDLNVYRMDSSCMASSSDYPPNDVFYQSLTGFFNVSFTGAPMYVSRNHFYGADPYWADQVDLLEENSDNKQFANEWDDLFIHVEPNSGMLFDAYLLMQTNAYTTQDELFSGNRIMLPVFSVLRAGNISDYAVNELLTDLRAAIGMKSKILVVGIVGVAVTVILIALLRYRERVWKAGPIKQSLLESLEKEPEEEQSSNPETEGSGKEIKKESLLESSASHNLDPAANDF